jgi:hypothetical protein
MIGPIWLFFTFVFLVLAAWHAWQARHKMPEIAQQPGSIGAVNGIPTGTGALVRDLNAHIHDLNRASLKANVLAASGYVGAALTALFSWWTTNP